MEGSRAKRDYTLWITWSGHKASGKLKGQAKGSVPKPSVRERADRLQQALWIRHKAKELFRVLDLKRRLEEEVT